jgi:hypothetical protein
MVSHIESPRPATCVLQAFHTFSFFRVFQRASLRASAYCLSCWIPCGAVRLLLFRHRSDGSYFLLRCPQLRGRVRVGTIAPLARHLACESPRLGLLPNSLLRCAPSPRPPPFCRGPLPAPVGMDVSGEVEEAGAVERYPSSMRGNC